MSNFTGLSKAAKVYRQYDGGGEAQVAVTQMRFYCSVSFLFDILRSIFEESLNNGAH